MTIAFQKKQRHVFWISFIVFCTILFINYHSTVYQVLNSEVQSNSASIHKKAIFSFISFQGFEGCWWANQYILSAAKLGASIQKHATSSDFDMKILVTGWTGCASYAWKKLLSKSGWDLIQVNPIFYKPLIGESRFSWISGNRYEHTCQFTKLHLWNRVDYEVILYIDADALVANQLNTAALFSHKMLSNDSIGMHYDPEGPNFAADVMLLVPSTLQYKRLISKMGQLQADRELQEQTYLIEFFADRAYALSRDTAVQACHLGGENNTIADYSIIHYVGGCKPWDEMWCQQESTVCKLWHRAEISMPDAISKTA